MVGYSEGGVEAVYTALRTSHILATVQITHNLNVTRVSLSMVISTVHG